MKTISMLVLLGMVTGLLVLMSRMGHTQQSLDPGWQITVYLPINANDPTPDTTRNILRIGPRIENREVCRGLLGPIRDHFKEARKIDCE